MAYYTKNTERMDIHIEAYRGTILIKQKWKYDWLNTPGTSAWTYNEKYNFHDKVDNLVWNNWGKYFFLKVEGDSEFSKKHARTRWDVNFDVKWVFSSEHWNVKVSKIPSGTTRGSQVFWNNMEIKLDSEDIVKRKRNRGVHSYYQYPSVHEFGHTIGNSWVFGTGDEYNASSAHFDDKNSVMHIGNQMRDRHLGYILGELNTIIPNTTFSKY